MLVPVRRSLFALYQIIVSVATLCPGSSKNSSVNFIFLGKFFVLIPRPVALRFSFESQFHLFLSVFRDEALTTSNSNMELQFSTLLRRQSTERMVFAFLGESTRSFFCMFSSGVHEKFQVLTFDAPLRACFGAPFLPRPSRQRNEPKHTALMLTSVGDCHAVQKSARFSFLSLAFRPKPFPPTFAIVVVVAVVDDGPIGSSSNKVVPVVGEI